MLGGRAADRAGSRAAAGALQTGAGRGDGRRRRADARRLRRALPERDRRRPAGASSSTRRARSRAAGAVHDRWRTSPGAARSRHAADRRRSPGAAASARSCPVLGAAPEFPGTQRWFNTPGDRPLTLRELRGRVVLVDFWTYTCINCIRTLPYLQGLGRALPRRGADDRRRPHAGVPVRADAGNVARRDRAATGCATRSRRTTTTRPGTRTATSTGRRST